MRAASRGLLWPSTIQVAEALKEYRAGSALFLVWQQGRLDSETIYGNRTFGADLNQLWQAHPDNTFLIKMSYWFDR